MAAQLKLRLTAIALFAYNSRLWSLELLTFCNEYFLGNSDFIEEQQGSFNAILDECIEPSPTSCNKDTGSKQRLQKWSREHLFIVRGGGINDKWSPLFK